MTVIRCQIYFAATVKWRCLRTLVTQRVMPEAEAMRLLHGVVDTAELVDKIKRKFPDEDKDNVVVDKVRPCARARACMCMCVCVCARERERI